jgi:hypothetical protein
VDENDEIYDEEEDDEDAEMMRAIRMRIMTMRNDKDEKGYEDDKSRKR